MSTTAVPLTHRNALIVVALALALPGQGALREGPGTAAAQDQPSTTSAPSTASTGADFVKDREAIFDAFYRTGLDTGTAYAVTNLPIKKDNMTLLLKQGTLFLMKPIAGEVTGATFIGEGEASMTPPNRTERYMLKKYYGADVLKEPFPEAVFRFSDGTDKTLLAAAKPDPAGTTHEARAVEIFQDRNSWLNGTRELHLELQFLENRISGLKGQDFFLADFHSSKHDWLTYLHNPEEIQENSLASRETMGAKGRSYLLPWNVWHKQADYGAGGYYIIFPQRDGSRVIRIQHTDLTISLQNTKTVEWESSTRVEPLINDLRCLRFDLANNGHEDSRWSDDSFWPVRVLSVSDENGASLPFMHKKDQLFVLLPRPLPGGTTFTLAANGQADVIYQVTPESYGLIQATWYPKYGYLGGRSSFRWTIRVPKPFLVAASGRILREYEDKERRQNIFETESNVPVNFPWAIFGQFKKDEAVYTGEESKKPIGLTIHTSNIDGSPIPRGKVEGFFSESQEILKLFENIYGPYPYQELHIAQMGPELGFGQGPPYFVQLTGEAFMSQATTRSDFIHGFLAHEIAHQWWGNQVGWASNEDWWLSEGFAEYAAGIFVKELQGAKRFQGTLEAWRKNAKISDKEAPIAAAMDLVGPKYGLYRDGLLYNKAPYVLHMLRVQLDDEKYRKVMRSIQETYKNQDITTEMLLREVNKAAGADYTYFFDQWFWDVGIPTFRYTWKSERQPDGKFLISVHVSQDDKDHIKRVLMPVHIHFKDKTIPQYKPVTQASQEIKILSPVEPKDVTLDDERTLLAEIVKAR